MKVPLSPVVGLHNPRIPAADAERQRRTAAAILERFETQPGVILADEVGMGKTYVALAVAYSVVEASDFGTQVVVMVPNSVRHKWPREWTVFREKCLPRDSPIRAAQDSVSDAVSFLKLLDDPIDQRSHILFATHGALTGQLQDPFVRLAILSRVLHRKSLAKQRNAFPKFARRLLRDSRFENRDFVSALLGRSPLFWRHECESYLGWERDDDPVPQSVVQVMNQIRFDDLAATLEKLPLYESAAIEGRLKVVRGAIAKELRDLWTRFLESIEIALPLLVLDEAHHLKNPDTQLSRILTPGRDAEGAEQKGALAKTFRRMLFLSATPFQLGHRELVEILRRFEGIRWLPDEDPAAYQRQVAAIDSALGRAQIEGLALDQAWGRITPEAQAGHQDRAWWAEEGRDQLPDSLQRAAEAIDRARGAIQEAEGLLRPWVIRHGRADRDQRRRRLPGRSILDDDPRDPAGLQVAGDAVFPFLLAARAQAIVADEVRRGGHRGQALFAQGLASSFEAYRETRRRKLAELMDDKENEVPAWVSREVDWYLRHIDRALPDDQRDLWMSHPKIAATARRAAELWDRGEKLVVFCFYRATGRALRRHLSRALEQRIVQRGAERLGLRPEDAGAVLESLRRISENRFDRDAPLRRAVEELAAATLSRAEVPKEWLDPDEDAGREGLLDLVVRFLRTPSFLVRYFDLREENLVAAFHASYAETSFGGLTLEEQLYRLGRFLVERTEEERDEILDALASVQTGGIGERLVDDDEESDRSVLLPNIRLVNGKTRNEARRTLLLAFNTPFFPEILVASSVMAEGVDLHLACRHVIHHDLDWNPSALEQRTGRLDRIGSKAEVVGLPVHVYEPFVEATQDEKMFRVVKDRERWFNVVMGQGMTMDEASTEKAAARAPLPPTLAHSLSMKLALDG